MKSKIIILSVLVVFLGALFFINVEKKTPNRRQKHVEFLANSPFLEESNLTKAERKVLGLPPNKYFEQEWELSMNPLLGRPTPENLIEIQRALQTKRTQEGLERTVPGDAADNMWEERGPNNIGGRTKALIFDPNDTTNKTVFAGGVSGGLWKNTDITDVNSAWTLVDIPENLAVTSIKVDPNDSNIFYIGTGESYTVGNADGNGVWKSTDGGGSWSHVFGGKTADAVFQSNAEVVVNSPANIAATYAAVKAGFGPDLTTFSGDLVLADDSSASPTEACNALTNAVAINGHIAVIERGNCIFTEKVKFAQDAGAIGVLMINNVAGPPIIQGGTDSTITIPSVMISKTDGALLIDELNAANTVSITVNPVDSYIDGGYLVAGQLHINDIAIRDNAGISEVYAAVGDSFYSDASSPTYMSGADIGLYKSVDEGATWEKLNIPDTSNGNPSSPIDLEIDADNAILLSTTYSYTYDDGGGYIFKSTDGISFALKYRVPNARRTELAVSASDSNKVFVLAQINSNTEPVRILRTLDGFSSTPTTLVLPNDIDGGIPSNDFTRGQAFYDLTIEIDPTNDAIVYVGGIDLFKSSNSGGFWVQISHWTGSYNHDYVHADQHGISFSSDGEMIFGTDGGVFYSSDNGNTIHERNNNYNVTQFYKVAVGPTDVFAGEMILAGAQDNGSLLMENAAAGINAATEASGGDGGFCFFDQAGPDKYHITNYVYNRSIKLHNYITNSDRTINSESVNNGDFINQLALDSNKNLLYSNYSTATSNAIRRYSNLLTGTIGKTNMSNALLNGKPTYLEVSPYTVSSTTLLVGTRNSKLLKVVSANNGIGLWSEITGSDFFGSVSDIQFGQSEDEIFVTMHNYGVNNIFYTSNGGSSWTQKDGNLPDLPVKCILQNPLNVEQVIIGTDLGVWWTQNFSDANPNWQQAYNGMSSVKVTDLQMRDDNKVYAATYGRGIFSGMFTAADSTVGVADLENSQLKLYPNPTSSQIGFDLINNSANKVNYKVYDTNGKLLISKELDHVGDSVSIDVTMLNQGIYLLDVNVDGKLYREKFVVE